MLNVKGLGFKLFHNYFYNIDASNYEKNLEKWVYAKTGSVAECMATRKHFREMLKKINDAAVAAVA